MSHISLKDLPDQIAQEVTKYFALRVSENAQERDQCPDSFTKICRLMRSHIDDVQRRRSGYSHITPEQDPLEVYCAGLTDEEYEDFCRANLRNKEECQPHQNATVSNENNSNNCDKTEKEKEKEKYVCADDDDCGDYEYAYDEMMINSMMRTIDRRESDYYVDDDDCDYDDDD